MVVFRLLYILEKNLVKRTRMTAVAATMLAGLSLTACSSNSTDKTSPTQSASASPTETANALEKLPNVNVDGNWNSAGDVCRIIDANTAGEALDYAGNLIAKHDAEGLPAVNGLDVCYYTDDAEFVLLNVMVTNGMTSERWNQTITEDVGGQRKSYNPNIPGVDESFVNSDGHAMVLKGDTMVYVLNNTLHEKVTSKQAANLAATVAKLF